MPQKMNLSISNKTQNLEMSTWEKLFKDNIEAEVETNNEKEEIQLIEYKESIIKKILNKIKRLFKK